MDAVTGTVKGITFTTTKPYTSNNAAYITITPQISKSSYSQVHGHWFEVFCKGHVRCSCGEVKRVRDESAATGPYGSESFELTYQYTIP